MSIAERVYVVTGGGGAIAQPILRAFAQAGARLVVAGRDVDAAARSVDGVPLTIDLLDPDSGAELVRVAREKWGRIDGLIHTAGAFAMGRAHEGDPALYDRMFDVNVRTLWHALRAVVPALVERGEGFICGIASEPAWNGAAPGTALYGAAKAALSNLLHSLAAELKKTSVKVAVVYPMGAVDTPANRRDMPGFAAFIDPVDIADAIVFAASKSSRMLELPIWPG